MADAFDVMMDALDRTEIAIAEPAKHTPGPWEIRDGSFIDAPGMTCLANVRGAHVTDLIECQANAKLIACAPEMAEALKSAVDLISDHWSGVKRVSPRQASEAVSRARDALAKAGVE